MPAEWLDQVLNWQLPIAPIAEGATPAVRPLVGPLAEPLVGHYHPSLPYRVQIISAAAEANRLTGAPLWLQQPPLGIVIPAEIDPAPWSALAAQQQIHSSRSPRNSSETLWRLRSAYASALAPQQTLHATLVQVLGLGVLLMGASGVGKSELALDLIARGHRLIADDAVELLRPAAGCLLGRCAPLLRGFLEVRGLGILDIRAAYGSAAMASQTRVDLALQLDAGDTPPTPLERLHGRRDTLDLLGVAVPHIALPARLRISAVMVEAACRDHWLRQTGYDASHALTARQSQRASAPLLLSSIPSMEPRA